MCCNLTLLEAITTDVFIPWQWLVTARAVFMNVLTLMLGRYAEHTFCQHHNRRERDICLCHWQWSTASAKQDYKQLPVLHLQHSRTSK
ncbi:putative glucan 1,3-beta-glucosidase A [Fusarium oxysporum f. sp. albedinis]|nr:putative glucan 1,3-beta-glucosidase A [Fusarium oxysporum f. sp. albedinis]